MAPPTIMAEKSTETGKSKELSDRLPDEHPTEGILKATASIFTTKGDKIIQEHGTQIGECLSHMERCRPCTDKYQTYLQGIRNNGNGTYRS